MAFSLSPIGNEQQVTQNGAPLSGGLLYTYLAGSSTPAATYTDSSGATPQSNPIVLNVLGRPTNPVWLTDGTAYKLVLTDSAGVTQWTIDNVTGVAVTTPAQSEWETLATTPTYINATQFTVPGDQTTALHLGRRVRLPCTGGVRYGVISVSAFTTLTTVTVELDSGSLDSGLSGVAVGILSAANSSMPWLKSNSTGLTALGKFTLDADAAAALEAVTLQQMQAAVAAVVRGGVRQTVLSGPVDSDGLPAFGGSTGSTTVTASGTLVATAANGWNASGALDRVGSITNPSWTGLSINGAMYLYLDIAANGACTPGSTTLAPIYQWGGVYSTTSGQNTYNIQEAVMQVGNGSTASQVYRVFVGEVTVSGGVVTAITWYALMGRYVSPDTSVPAANTPVNFSHNIGVTPNITVYIKNAVPELGFSVGDVVTVPRQDDGATLMEVVGSRLGATYISNQPSFALINKSTGGTRIAFTAVKWRVFVKCDRGW